MSGLSSAQRLALEQACNGYGVRNKSTREALIRRGFVGEDGHPTEMGRTVAERAALAARVASGDQEAARLLGASGGVRSTERKAEAAKANGRKGGRPRRGEGGPG